jgi:hypothetical protein
VRIRALRPLAKSAATVLPGGLGLSHFPWREKGPQGHRGLDDEFGAYHL